MPWHLTDWAKVAEDFTSGRLVPAGGWDAWQVDAANEVSRVTEHVRRDDVSWVFEVGCGVGRLTHHLAAAYDYVVTSDAEPAMVDLITKKLPLVPALQYRLGDPLPDFPHDPAEGMAYVWCVLENYDPEDLDANTHRGAELLQSVNVFGAVAFSTPPDWNLRAIARAAGLDPIVVSKSPGLSYAICRGAQ